MKKTVLRDKNDIYGYPILGFIFKNSSFLLFLKISVALLFFFAIFYGFYNATDNSFTKAVFWSLFWPFFMVITLSSLGRVFCGVCPHGFIGKYITKFGLKKEPPSWLKNPFIGLLLLVGLYWSFYYAYPTALKSSFASAIFFAIMSVVAFLSFYLFRDMSYCKYICPIGGVSRAFSKASSTKLSTYKEHCDSCRTFECSSACSYNLSPFNFDKKNSMSDCTLCMDCASACEAVSFKLTPPSASLLKPINKPYKLEVWAFILITAAITFTMQFHHALGRCAVTLDMPWYKSAIYLREFLPSASIDLVGFMAFVYAVFIALILSVGGLFIASKIVDKKFSDIFYNLGYGFAPIFIIGGLSHTLEFLFLHYYSDFINGFNQMVGLTAVEPLAHRGSEWIKVFKLFNYIGGLWSLYIIYKRLSFIDAPRYKKALAYPFASALVLFFIFMVIYIPYAFMRYGMISGVHH